MRECQFLNQLQAEEENCFEENVSAPKGLERNNL